MKLSISLEIILILAASSLCRGQLQGGFLENLFGSRNGKSASVKTKDCNGPDCFIDSSTLDITGDDIMDSISFDKSDGRSVKCNMRELGKHAKNNEWVGKCDGQGFAHLFQGGTNSKGEKLLYGSIVDSQDVCRFVPDGNGNNRMLCTPVSDAPIELEPLVPVEESITIEDLGIGSEPVDLTPNSLVPETYGLKGSAASKPMNDETRRNLNGGTIIDILVVWTKAAECRNSNYNPGCTLSRATETNMRNQINAAIGEANEAFDNSQVNTSFRLVYTYRDPTFVDGSSGTGISDALNALQSTNDGNMDDVHAKRTKYGADLVAMITGVANNDGNSFYCGRASVGPRADLMFSVTDRRCLTGFDTFAHEIGHNFGLNHDRGTEDACSASGYSYGYRHPQALFRTIMAYNCRTGQCDNVQSDGCSRIRYFSSNSINEPYGGLPIGNDQANSARRIDEEKATIAGYYPSKFLCETMTDCPNGDPCLPISTCDDGVCLYNQLDCYPGPFSLSTGQCNSCYVYSGIMFDVEAKNYDIRVTGIKLWVSGPGTAEIWTRQGSYAGYETTQSAWTNLVPEHSYPPPSSGGNFQLVDIPLPQSVTIDANTRRGFYATIPSGSLLFEASGQAEDVNLRILAGPANVYRFGNKIGSYWWNGEITYEKIVAPPSTTAAATTAAATTVVTTTTTIPDPTTTTPVSSSWALLTFDDFESGLGNFVGGGSDARRSIDDSAHAHSGSYCVRIRDNTDTSVVTLKDSMDVSGYSELRVSFWYKPVSMDNSNEDFWLQYSSNGGSSWTTVKSWARGVDFENNNFYNPSVVFSEASAGVTFSSNAKIRFRCDASGDADWIYIDDVLFEGISSWTRLTFDDFEQGFGNFVGGGSDARRSIDDSAHAHSGSYCVRIRDNTDTSVVTLKDSMDVSGYSELRVSFWYKPVSMDNSNEDFWLQYSSNGGSSWTTVKSWARGVDFENNNFYNPSVVFSEASAGATFSSNSKIRFRCDASGNADWIYIDDVLFEGKT